MPMLAASPASWIESEMIATLPVRMPPTNSKIEKNRFRINAINMFLVVFIPFIAFLMRKASFRVDFVCTV